MNSACFENDLCYAACAAPIMLAAVGLFETSSIRLYWMPLEPDVR